MKILFVSQYFYPENFKGNDIVFDFVKKGYDVTVLTGKPNYPQGKFYEGYSFFGKKEEVIKGAKILRVPLFPRRSGKTIPLVINYLSFIFFSYFAVLFRVKERYDAVFVQQLSPVTMALPGIWIKKRQNIPLFLWVLDLWPESITATTNVKKGFVINFIERLVKKIYRQSDVILMSSKSFESSIRQKCDDKSKVIEYFPNWAEDVFVRSNVIEYKIPDLPKGFNIMFAGNVGESQGFETILKAAEETKQYAINWVVVGDGRKVSWIKKEIKMRNIENVYLLGRFPLKTMPLFFRKADIMLVSLKDEPVFSITVPAKIQAYMASGKIILGMLNGEGKELINDSKCGYAVASGDTKALIEKSIMLSKLSDKEKKEMSANSKKYYNNNFAKDKLFSKLENLFSLYNQ